MNSASPRSLSGLLDVAGLFLRLGATAFGGPAAHIALMEQEVVVERGWVSRKEFLDLLGIVNLIPGPNSTEMAMFVGYRRAGLLGLLAAGIGFILPAALIVSLIACAYVNYGKLPEAEGLLYGIKPVIIAVMVQAMWNLGRTAVNNWWRGSAGAGAIILTALGTHPLLVLVAAGAFMLAGRLAVGPRPALAGVTPFFGATSGFRLLSTASTMAPFSLAPMILFFLKVGSVLFGSGYVLLVYLHADLVEHRHWLTESQLLDAVSVGQFTPGPMLTTATFIGYVLGGPQAAVLATVAIFLPAFLLVGVLGPSLPRLLQFRPLVVFLEGVTAASLGMMAVVTWQLSRTALVDWLTIALGIAAGVWLLRYRVNSTWLILGGAALGLARVVLSNGP